ncbi:hypothetical protein FQN50_000921 [Emmonsiellopsis sp. PD_5]|nr:hypothetical protein FQN50_000921 [Emmonsiellopsis sp. PD_5]
MALPPEREEIRALFGREGVVDYSQGYGHFLFWPHETSDCDDGPLEEYPADPESIMDSSTSFPLMKLPLEIRHRIYYYLLVPLSESFYKDVPEMKGKKGIRFAVSDETYDCFCQKPDFSHSTTRPNRRNMGLENPFELYRAVVEGTATEEQANFAQSVGLFDNTERELLRLAGDEAQWMSGGTSCDSAVATDDDESSIESNLSEHQIDRMKSLPDHTQEVDGACRCIYTLQVHREPIPGDDVSANTVDSMESAREFDCECCGYQDYTPIRPLFYVSHKFTEEIGEYLWKNAIIRFETPECFFSFIAPRPAILPHIKLIELRLQYHDDWFDTPTETVVAILQFISAHMTLPYLSVTLTTDLECFKKVVSGEALPEWNTAFKSLVVSQRLDVFVKLWPREWITTNNLKLKSRGGEFDEKLRALWAPEVLEKAE